MSKSFFLCFYFPVSNETDDICVCLFVCVCVCVRACACVCVCVCANVNGQRSAGKMAVCLSVPLRYSFFFRSTFCFCRSICKCFLLSLYLGQG